MLQGSIHIKNKTTPAERIRRAFQPFSGLADGAMVEAGHAPLPQAPGIGFELHDGARNAFRALFGD